METNVFFSAVQSALDAHIERMVDARLKEILTTNKAYEMIMSNLSDRVTALENNHTPLHHALDERIAALETKLTEAKLFEQTTNVTIPIDEAKMVEAMNNAEWLWEKVNAYIETGIEDRIERAIDDHCETYDHDSYDTVVSNWNDEDPTEFVRESDIDDKIKETVEEVLNDASFSISI